MRFVIVAHARSETNTALAGAAASLGLPALVLPPHDALAAVEAPDIVLGRLRARDDRAGLEPGLTELERIAAAGAVVLNPASALVAAHDRHLTARLLRRAGVPHPRTWLLGDGAPAPAPELPVVVKPRFGRAEPHTSCANADELAEALLRHRGRDLVAQEPIPRARDLRLVVVGGRVVDEPLDLPPLARRLAVDTARALGCDFARVELRVRKQGLAVTDVDPAPELGSHSPRRHRAVLHELLAAAAARPEAA